MKTVFQHISFVTTYFALIVISRYIFTSCSQVEVDMETKPTNREISGREDFPHRGKEEMSSCETQKTQDEKEEEELGAGGLNPELLAQLANDVPDVELDFTSKRTKLISGLGNSLPFAPIVNNMRGVMPAAAVPQQAAQQHGPPNGPRGAGAGAGGAGAGQGQQIQGQGRGAPPPPLRYVWEDGEVAYTDDTKTMLC